MAVARETVRLGLRARAARRRSRCASRCARPSSSPPARERAAIERLARRRARRAQRQGAALRRARPTSSARYEVKPNYRALGPALRQARCRRWPRRSRRSTRRTSRRRCATAARVGINVDGHDHELGADDLSARDAAARGLPARARGLARRRARARRSTTSCAARARARGRARGPERAQGGRPRGRGPDRARRSAATTSCSRAAREHEALRRRRDARASRSPTTATATASRRPSRAARSRSRCGGTSSREPRARRRRVAAPRGVARGADVLRAGGTAVDAVVAANAMLGVVYPHMCGVGGDLFLLHHEARTRRRRRVSTPSGPAPALATRAAFARADSMRCPPAGRSRSRCPAASRGGRPRSGGSARGRSASCSRPAIAAAEDGVEPTERLAGWIAGARELLAAAPLLRERFLGPAGRRLRQPELGRTLRAVAAGGAEGFYRGAVADEIDAAMRAADGLLRRDDLRRTRRVGRARAGPPPRARGGHHAAEQPGRHGADDAQRARAPGRGAATRPGPRRTSRRWRRRRGPRTPSATRTWRTRAAPGARRAAARPGRDAPGAGGAGRRAGSFAPSTGTRSTCAPWTLTATPARPSRASSMASAAASWPADTGILLHNRGQRSRWPRARRTRSSRASGRCTR